MRFLPQRAVIRVEVHGHAEVLSHLGRELAVVVVRVGEDNALNGALSYLVDDALGVVGRIDDVALGVA